MAATTNWKPFQSVLIFAERTYQGASAEWPADSYVRLVALPLAGAPPALTRESAELSMVHRYATASVA